MLLACPLGSQNKLVWMWLFKMDEIIIRGMQFYGYHGVFPEETITGQRFCVDVYLRLDLQEAGRSDSVKHTVDYGKVYEVTRTIV